MVKKTHYFRVFSVEGFPNRHVFFEILGLLKIHEQIEYPSTNRNGQVKLVVQPPFTYATLNLCAVYYACTNYNLLCSLPLLVLP